MLASIVPGLRHARSPLITGYLFLLALWIAFGNTLEVQYFDSRSAVSQITGPLIEYFGQSAIIAALSVAAYLTGTVIQVDARGLLASSSLRKTTVRNRSRADLLAYAERVAQEAIAISNVKTSEVMENNP